MTPGYGIDMFQCMAPSTKFWIRSWNQCFNSETAILADLPITISQIFYAIFTALGAISRFAHTSLADWGGGIGIQLWTCGMLFVSNFILSLRSQPKVWSHVQIQHSIVASSKDNIFNACTHAKNLRINPSHSKATKRILGCRLSEKDIELFQL